MEKRTSRCCSRHPSSECLLPRRTSSVRRQLEVITEETDTRVQYCSSRRKQLIPRAKLAPQHRRAVTEEDNHRGAATERLPVRLQYQKRNSTGQGPIRYKYSSRQRVPEYTFSPPFVDVPLDSPQGFHEESRQTDHLKPAEASKSSVDFLPKGDQNIYDIYSAQGNPNNNSKADSGVIYDTPEEDLSHTQTSNDTSSENPPEISEIEVRSNSFAYKDDVSALNGRNTRLTYSTGTYKVTTFGKRRRNRSTGAHIPPVNKIFNDKGQKQESGEPTAEDTVEDEPHEARTSKQGIYGKPRCANVVSVVVKRASSPPPTGVVASSVDGVSTVQVSSGNMSRRPQVLQVQDSSTIQRNQDKVVITDGGYAVPRSCKAVKPSTIDAEQETSKMNSVLEGKAEKRQASSKAIQTSTEDNPATKPMLIATLQTSPASSPTKDEDKKITNNKTPAFRAFSGDGQESNLTTLRSITRSIPEYLNHKSFEANADLGSAMGNKDSKVAVFDGLLQYLQEYRHGLRELLVNNNVVIIEPVRQSPVKLEDRPKADSPEGSCRITGATVKEKSEGQKAAATPGCNTLPHHPVLRRHFFYHPIKTNRELVDEELPDPDKVKTAREMFERTLKIAPPAPRNIDAIQEEEQPKKDTSKAPVKVISIPKAITGRTCLVGKKRDLTVDTVFRQEQRRWTDSGSLSSGVSSDLSCYETDLESPRGCDNLGKRERGIFTSSSDDEETDEGNARCRDLDGEEGGHYVPAEVLEKIRACGTSVTYYGGRVIAASDGAPFRSPMTLAIMDEIKRNGNKNIHVAARRDQLFGVKFRLVKSNSCSSRLELAGTGEEDDDDRLSGTEAPASTPEPLDNVVNEKSVIQLSNGVLPNNLACLITVTDYHDGSPGPFDNHINDKPLLQKANTLPCMKSSMVDSDVAHPLDNHLNDKPLLQKSSRALSDNLLKPNMICSPEKVEMLKRGSSAIFGEMEFEEFEVLEEVRYRNPAQKEEGVAKHVESEETDEQVHMTTWARQSRSLGVDFRDNIDVPPGQSEA